MRQSSGIPVRVNGLSVTPVAVDHIVPTYGYIVTDGRINSVFGADSGPTERIWQLAQLASATQIGISGSVLP